MCVGGGDTLEKGVIRKENKILSIHEGNSETCDLKVQSGRR